MKVLKSKNLFVYNFFFTFSMEYRILILYFFSSRCSETFWSQSSQTIKNISYYYHENENYVKSNYLNDISSYSSKVKYYYTFPI